jgi:hypothetical protein
MCRAVVGEMHELGDHRLCDGASCGFLLTWRGRIVKAGMAECAASGRTYCVVSVHSGEVTVHGTFNSLAQAKPARTAVGRLGPGGGFERWAAKQTTVVVCEQGHLH